MPFPFYSKDKKNTSPALEETGGFSFDSALAWLFAIDERESLDAKTGGDKSDGRWTWGL
ncbi:MAG: hypothetical protein JWQ21_1505 [Herminiimonas sp.]|nr:hypothetical protein [Herminiimonas sp.]